MAYVNKKRPYKKEYQQQKARGEHANRMERQRLRRKVDSEGRDANGNGKADAREGRDLSHNKALGNGGSNADGYKIKSASANRSFRRDSNGKLVSETSKREKKRKKA